MTLGGKEFEFTPNDEQLLLFWRRKHFVFWKVFTSIKNQRVSFGFDRCVRQGEMECMFTPQIVVGVARGGKR